MYFIIVPFYYLYFIIVPFYYLYFIIVPFYYLYFIIVLTYFILIYTVMLRLANIGAGYFALKSILAKIAFSFFHFFWTLTFSNFLRSIVFG